MMTNTFSVTGFDLEESREWCLAQSAQLSWFILRISDSFIVSIQ